MSDEMKIAQESARGGFFLIFGTAISTATLAISAILIARLLSPDAYGQYSLVIVVPQLLFLFTDLGLNQGVTKFTAECKLSGDYSRLASIIKHSLIIRVIIGIVIFLINFFGAELFATYLLNRPELSYLVQISSIVILFQIIFTTAIAAFVGIDKTEYNALTTNLQSLTKTILQIMLILIGFSVAGAIIGHVVSYLIAGLIGILLLYYLIRKQKKTKIFYSLKENAKTLLNYGGPLYLSVVLIGIVPLFQTLVLGFFVSDFDIGNFKAATNFASLMTIFSIPIATAILPAFSKLNSLNGNISDFFKMANKYTTILIVPITILIVIFSSQIVNIVYGSTYQLAPVFLSTYCLAYLLVGFGYLTLASFYNGLGETKITLRVSLITFIILAIFSPVLSSIYGVQGMIIGYLIANTAGQTYSSFYARKKFKVKFDTHGILGIYLVSAISSILPIILIYFTNLSSIITLVIGVVFFLVTYITLIPLIRIVTISELKQATVVMEKIRILSSILKPIINYQQKLLERKTVTTKDKSD